MVLGIGLHAVELLIYCTTYILKLARGGLLLELLGASVAARY